MPGWLIRHRAEVSGVECPCGVAQRVLTAADGAGCSVHFVSIRHDSARHYHRRSTEVYVVIAGHGEIELDGQRHRLEPGTVVLIPPLTRHRAVPGDQGLELLNVVQPPFDARDEYHD
ncbi:MAG: cupin domain-containing protein [Fimbriimonadaceae bacterium]|nr:cupin domain-containing protein [Fimbriimonadaceae bacterium]